MSNAHPYATFNPYAAFIKPCVPDSCDMEHTLDGRLVRVHRPGFPKRGASVVNRKRFNASLREHNETPIDAPSFIVGLFAGAFCAFVLVSMVAFCAWCL